MLEALFTFANPRWIDKLGTTLRRGPSVISETYAARRNNAHAYPFLQPDTYLDSSGQPVTIGGIRTIPLSGAANALTILCN